jgi:hypothetical protein
LLQRSDASLNKIHFLVARGMNPTPRPSEQQIIADFLHDVVTGTDTEGQQVDWLQMGHAFVQWARSKGYTFAFDTMHLKKAVFEKYGQPPWTTLSLRPLA